MPERDVPVWAVRINEPPWTDLPLVVLRADETVDVLRGHFDLDAVAEDDMLVWSELIDEPCVVLRNRVGSIVFLPDGSNVHPDFDWTRREDISLAWDAHQYSVPNFEDYDELIGWLRGFGEYLLGKAAKYEAMRADGWVLGRPGSEPRNMSYLWDTAPGSHYAPTTAPE